MALALYDAAGLILAPARPLWADRAVCLCRSAPFIGGSHGALDQGLADRLHGGGCFLRTPFDNVGEGSGFSEIVPFRDLISQEFKVRIVEGFDHGSILLHEGLFDFLALNC